MCEKCSLIMYQNLPVIDTCCLVAYNIVRVVLKPPSMFVSIVIIRIYAHIKRTLSLVGAIPSKFMLKRNVLTTFMRYKQICVRITGTLQHRGVSR